MWDIPRAEWMVASLASMTVASWVAMMAMILVDKMADRLDHKKEWRKEEMMGS